MDHKMGRRLVGVLAAAMSVSLLALSGCSGADVEKAQEIKEACAETAEIGNDMVNFAKSSLHSGSVGFENIGAFIDATAARNDAEVQRLGKEVGDGLPPADAKLFREKLDRYGVVVKKCRLGMESNG